MPKGVYIRRRKGYRPKDYLKDEWQRWLEQRASISQDETPLTLREKYLMLQAFTHGLETGARGI